VEWAQEDIKILREEENGEDGEKRIKIIVKKKED